MVKTGFYHGKNRLGKNSFCRQKSSKTIFAGKNSFCWQKSFRGPRGLDTEDGILDLNLLGDELGINMSTYADDTDSDTG